MVESLDNRSVDDNIDCPDVVMLALWSNLVRPFVLITRPLRFVADLFCTFAAAFSVLEKFLLITAWRLIWTNGSNITLELGDWVLCSVLFASKPRWGSQGSLIHAKYLTWGGYSLYFTFKILDVYRFWRIHGMVLWNGITSGIFVTVTKAGTT